MSDPFQSSRRKIARAKKHIADLEREIEVFIRETSYIRFSEPDPKNPTHTVYKIRMSKPLPEGLSEIAGDAVGNLREALDHATFGVAVASGRIDPHDAYFPFAGTAERLDNTIKGRCKDIPKEIYPLLRAFKPYNGGNEVLFTLNRIAIRNKHRLLIPVGAISLDAGMNVRGQGYFCMPTPHVWDHTKNEMILITLGPGAQFNAHFRFANTIAFAGIKIIEREAAVEVLDTIHREVERVLAAIEAESLHLGFVK